MFMLVVDDVESMQQMLQFLKRMKGFAVKVESV
jgi:hypothetical protein